MVQPGSPNFLFYLFYQIYSFFHYLGLIDASADGQIAFTGGSYIFALEIILLLIGIVGTVFLIIFLSRLINLRWEENEEAVEILRKNLAPVVDNRNLAWEKVQQLFASGGEANFKLAIIESDKMLEDLLTSLNYQGLTLGDKLLAVEKGDMQNLDSAWEAHKCRNQIAHEKDFQLSDHEARRVLGLYEKVFREYQYIPGK